MYTHNNENNRCCTHFDMQGQGSRLKKLRQAQDAYRSGLL